jgi:hypothetical protein
VYLQPGLVGWDVSMLNFLHFSAHYYRGVLPCLAILSGLL